MVRSRASPTNRSDGSLCAMDTNCATLPSSATALSATCSLSCSNTTARNVNCCLRSMRFAWSRALCALNMFVREMHPCGRRRWRSMGRILGEVVM